MATKKFNTASQGEVIVRNIIIDTDETNLEEGLEVKTNSETFEIIGFVDLDDLTKDQVEDLIKDY